MKKKLAQIAGKSKRVAVPVDTSSSQVESSQAEVIPDPEPRGGGNEVSELSEGAPIENRKDSCLRDKSTVDEKSEQDTQISEENEMDEIAVDMSEIQITDEVTTSY